MKKGACWLIHHILLLLHRTHLPLPRWHPRSKTCFLQHIWGNPRSYTLLFQRKIIWFLYLYQNSILSYLNVCDWTACASCMVIWDRLPLFMITVAYIQLVLAHSHLQTTPLMMQDTTNKLLTYFGINVSPNLQKGNHPYRPLLILLILGNQIIHVGLGFSELHLIHTFTSIPMKEGFSTEHSSKVPFVEMRLGGLSKSCSWRNVENSMVWVGETSGGLYEHHHCCGTYKTTPKHQNFWIYYVGLSQNNTNGSKKRLSETWMSGSATLLNISWMAVEFPAKATAIFKPLGGMSHTEACKTIFAGRSANPSC